MDIRGWQEMHPLNSVGWSLFFEYVANILYALGLRKLPNKALACFVVLTGAVLLHFAVTNDFDCVFVQIKEESIICYKPLDNHTY